MAQAALLVQVLPPIWCAYTLLVPTTPVKRAPISGLYAGVSTVCRGKSLLGFQFSSCLVSELQCGSLAPRVWRELADPTIVSANCVSWEARSPTTAIHFASDKYIPARAVSLGNFERA